MYLSCSRKLTRSGRLIALYIVAENEKLGLRVKLAGEGKLDEHTGQITTSFQNTPQVPFEELEARTVRRGRAGRSAPRRYAAAYTTTSAFTAWSGSVAEPSAEPFRSPPARKGRRAPTRCRSLPPSLAGVSASRRAPSRRSPCTIGHPDADQPLQGLTMHLPAGVAAMLASVTPCQEPPAAQEWACGPESLIGHSTAWSGLGHEPVTLAGQRVSHDGYEGAPFGLLVVTPAVAGPFNLGNVDVRSRINVDPSTAAVTITSDPFPTFVRGVPAQIKQIGVTSTVPASSSTPPAAIR